MKKIIVFSMMMAFAFIIGTAFADEMPTMRDTGSELYLEVFPPQGAVIRAPAVKDFSVRGPIGEDALVDNESFPIHKLMLTEKSAEGAAAGGVVREDENTRIWDNLLAPTGASLE